MTTTADSRQLRYDQRKKSAAAEVGDIPPPANKRRRAKYGKDLPGFLRHYMPHLFSRPFSPDQLEAIGKIQRAMIDGGQFAEAMPRGTGKTTILEGAMIWGSLYAHRRFLVVIGSDQKAADSIIRDIKTEIETNDRLADDFPEVCLPARHIEGRGQRCATQTVKGVRTLIEWKAGDLVYPTIEGSVSSGTVIRGRGLTSGVRGMKRGAIRPDFVLLDDPQTRESAESESQTNSRENIILGDVMGLAGHDKRISAVMACTVIRKGDLADRYLDREKHPEWQGHRTPLVYNWADSESLWVEYHEIWKSEQREGRGIDAATDFYLANRAAMDKGARVTCDHLYDTGNEASAIQHAYNLLYTVGESAFAAEYQNDPEDASKSLYDITPDIVASRCNGVAKWTVPDSAGIVTGFADINFAGLHWVVAGWENNFTGFVAGAGKTPGGKKVLVPKGTAHPEGLIYNGLTELMDQVATARIKRGNSKADLDLFMIDCGQWMDTVFKWIRMKGKSYPFPIIASRGWASTRYIQSKPIGRPGDGWHKTKFAGKGQVISHNADLWRMRMQKSFLLDVGAPGGVSLWGDSPTRHANLSDHICGEKLTAMAETPRGTLYKWEQVVGRRNDLGDAMTGAMVAAAACGASHTPSPKGARRKGKRVRKIKI